MIRKGVLPGYLFLCIISQMNFACPLFAEEPAKTHAPPAPQTFWDNVQYYRARPKQMLNPIWEFKAMRDLAIINNAAVRYYEKMRFFPVIMRQLTLDGFLPVAYESGKTDKYHYYFTNVPKKPDDFQLHADPLDTAAGLRSFFVGPDAVIRVSLGGPATAKSPEHHYDSKKA